MLDLLSEGQLAATFEAPPPFQESLLRLLNWAAEQSDPLLFGNKLNQLVLLIGAALASFYFHKHLERGDFPAGLSRLIELAGSCKELPVQLVNLALREASTSLVLCDG